MNTSFLAWSRDLVLVGGGHTHALVLRAWAMRPLPGVRLTLINPDPTAAYSGMLPGFVAGHYTREALDIDLVRLAQFAGARLVLTRAEGIDREHKRVKVSGGPDIAFDVLSLDVGITSEMQGLPGFPAHGTPAKPLGAFAATWQNYLDSSEGRGVVVIGGGIAGVELAMALRHRLRSEGRTTPVTILEKDRALSALGTPARRALLQALRTEGVALKERCAIDRVTAEGVDVADAGTVPADFVVGAAGAVPYGWLSETGLADDAGFIPVNARLQSRDPSIFAVGDCAELTESPRPKAGVYAVRQAPVLLHNLKAALAGTGGMKKYRAQKDYLKLVSLGRRAAQAEKFGIALAGPALWRLKDRIDRKFMDQFDSLPPPKRAVLPWPRAAETPQTATEMCGGCGAKMGPAALTSGLSVGALGDDAAIVSVAGQQQVMSTDHLRAFSADPVTMARIAAVHALGDIWAMGATPQAATATVILPRQSSELASRALSEITQAARGVFEAAGAGIVGGHSTLGAEMTIGFTVTGLCARPPITLKGARPGDRLVLTKPIGTGVIMAAHMRYKARGQHVTSAFAEMMKPQQEAAALLSDAHAMTDVTGFGLAGHLRNICMASGVGARLETQKVPLLPGAEALAANGIHSSLYAENSAGFPEPATARTALMFDPQTSGGLLAAVPGNAERLCGRLRAAGFQAAVIGEITSRAGQIDMV
jgi:selenide,water dikinase